MGRLIFDVWVGWWMAASLVDGSRTNRCFVVHF